MAWAAAIGAPHRADLRALSADELRKAGARAPDATRDVFDAARPVIDGQVLPGASRAMFEAGLQAAVPLLVGCAANEDFGMLCYARDLATYRAEAEADHGADSAEFLSLYPANDDRQALAASLKSNGHRLFTWQNWTWANLHAKAGHDVYYYRFDQAPPVPDGRYVEQQHPRPLGAFHGASIFYSFDRFWLREDWPWSAGDREVSRSLTAAWVNFARTGKPKAPGLPLWPQFEPKDPQVMAVCEAAALRPVPDRPYIDFWDRFYARRQAGSP
jgi:para-nitrobenzyl esterase